MNTAYVYEGAQVGEFRNALLWAAGPSSYTPLTSAGVGGDIVYNPGSSEFINFPCDCTTLSGNYRVRFVPTAVGLNNIRAGAPSPSQSGWTAVWEHAGASNVNIPGVALTLGTLSAAATSSWMTSNGVVTVNTTTPPPLNSFVLLTNGASSAGIFLDGAVVEVTAVVAGTSYSFNFAAAKSLTYGSSGSPTTDTLKWQQIFGGFSGNPVAMGTGTGQSITCTRFTVASNVLTVVATNTGVTVVPGMFVVIQGAAAGEVVQGAIVQVLTSSATGFTANIIAPNLSQTTGETATATVLVTNGNAPIIATQAIYPISGSTVAATAATSSAAGAITVLPVTQNLSAGNLVVVQGLGHGAALNGLITAALAASLSTSNVTTNGYIASAVTTGTGDAGILGLLMTGTQLYGNQVSSGTNLSAEQVQFAALESQL